jgi:predicted DNA-binding transcriptional regulator YafY
MDRTERFYKINQLLASHRSVTLERFLEEMEVSRATFKRDLEYMRDRMSAPIIWDRELRAYRYEHEQATAERYQLPGLWFNASEIHALMVMEHLLENIQPGLLNAHIRPLQGQIRAILGSRQHQASEIAERIRVLPQAARTLNCEFFEIIAAAVMSGRRLCIEHYNRGRDDISSREISPQRLVYYRDNWYLDAWCHLRNELRTFSLESIRAAEILPTGVRAVASRQLDEVLKSGYGIFSGSKTHTAVLRFNPQRARWVATEIWHPEQLSEYDSQGRYLLQVPYSDARELLMDILKYGPDVEVIKPASLRRQAMELLTQALENYSSPVNR